MTDQTAAELITRRIDQPLSSGEQADLDDHFAHCERTQNFSELITRIQACLEKYRSPEGLEQPGAGLDAITKERLQRRLLEVLTANLELRQVAEDPSTYTSDEKDKED